MEELNAVVYVPGAILAVLALLKFEIYLGRRFPCKNDEDIFCYLVAIIAFAIFMGGCVLTGEWIGGLMALGMAVCSIIFLAAGGS